MHKPEVAKPHQCTLCERSFSSEQLLATHRASAVHKPWLRTIPCRGYSCKKAFVTYADMVNHIESGTCASWVTRYTVKRDGDSESYECVLCHRVFRLLEDLNRHVDGPAHGERVYRCPTGFGGCGKEFASLSKLMFHFEKGGSRCGVKFGTEAEGVEDDTAQGMIQRMAEVC